MSILSLVPGMSELKFGAVVVVILAVTGVVGTAAWKVDSFIQQANADHAAVGIITADRDRVAGVANANARMALDAKKAQEALAAIASQQHDAEIATALTFRTQAARIAAAPKTTACATSPAVRAAMGWPDPPAAPRK